MWPCTAMPEEGLAPPTRGSCFRRALDLQSQQLGLGDRKGDKNAHARTERSPGAAAEGGSVAAARGERGSRLARDADVLVAVAVRGAADADEQDEAAGGAGADRGGGPVEAVVDVLHERGRVRLNDDRFAGRVGSGGPRAGGRGGERPGDDACGGEAGDAV